VSNGGASSGGPLVEKANATPTGPCHSIYKYARLCIAVKSTKGIRKMVGDMMMQQLVEMCQDARMMVKRGGSGRCYMSSYGGGLNGEKRVQQTGCL